MNDPVARALTRDAYGAGSRPRTARIVHLGLGSFHRAHQEWFTSHAGDGADWGICAFAGRARGVVDALARQDGLYTLIERSATEDHFEIIANLVEVHEGTDSDAIVDVFSRPQIAVVTTTVTESGYRLGLDGTPQDDAELDRDVAVLREATLSDDLAGLVLSTVAGRLLLGFAARRRCGAGPVALVPCDNLPNNGVVLRRGLTRLAARVSAEVREWTEENVSFVSTSVDRITPRTTDHDVALVAERTGWRDAVPVVTEPFASWVMAGDFPAGRPAWEDAGAVFVDRIEPYERRKLWLLNGAHSLLAYLGLEAGHDTVAHAIADPRCRDVVESFWASAAHHLGGDLEVDTYCAQLIERFENSRIEYRLEQIASDSVMKLRTRIAPVIIAEWAEGRDCRAGVEAVAAWVRLIRSGASFSDVEAEAVSHVVADSASPALDLVRLVDPRLVDPRLTSSGGFAGRFESPVVVDGEGGTVTLGAARAQWEWRTER